MLGYGLPYNFGVSFQLRKIVDSYVIKQFIISFNQRYILLAFDAKRLSAQGHISEKSSFS